MAANLAAGNRGQEDQRKPGSVTEWDKGQDATVGKKGGQQDIKHGS